MIHKVLNLVKTLFYCIIYKVKIRIKGNVWIKKDKTAKFEGTGCISLGNNSFGNNGRNVLLRMDKNSKIKLNGRFNIFYGCDIILFEGATLTVGNSFINSDAKIRCHKSITIGDNCAISHDFTIMDSNAHSLNGDRGCKPIIIEDGVWIGTRVTILSGVTIGEGSVIAAGSVVTKDVSPHCLVAGVPAKVVKENVEWEI